MTEMQVTLDKRVNIVSLANLGALVALLLTGIGSWYGMVGQVSNLNLRLDNATAELSRIRLDMKSTLDQRDVDVRALREKVDAISTKTVVIDTQLTSVVETLKRVESALDKGPPVRR